MERLTIAIDAMGGDAGASVTVPATLVAAARYPNIHFALHGDAGVMQALLPHALPNNVSVHHAPDVVAMDESPSHALKRKPQSSMRLALESLKAGQADACVSAGNTGALMAVSRFVLRTPPGVDRPAIITELPTASGGRVLMLDLGANVDNSAEHLHQFALMGSVAAQVLHHLASPKVALLNIGHEAIKGNEVVKQADALLAQEACLNYVGYVESDRLFAGEVDVVVCDGFVGNAVLKACEGTAKFTLGILKNALRNHWLGWLAGWLLRWVAGPALASLHPSRHNGALMLGLNGTVVKSHGSATTEGFLVALEVAIAGARDALCDKVAKCLDKPQDVG